MPSGALDIIFNFSEPTQVSFTKNKNDHLIFKKCFVFGINTSAVQNIFGKDIYCLGINLNMEGCASLLPLPINELTDLALESNMLYKETEVLYDKLGEIKEFRKQCSILLNWLQRLLKPPSKHEMILNVCNHLKESPTESNLYQLTRSINISERHLRRLFLQHVGISPAKYLRMSRFIKAINLMSTTKSLTEIAHAVEYTDQAHFCHDFKSFACITPKNYRKVMSNVPGHIFA